MMTIDRLEQKVEKLMEQVRSLSFPFKDEELQQEAENARDEIIELLESYIELATQDWESRSETETEEEE